MSSTSDGRQCSGTDKEKAARGQKSHVEDEESRLRRKLLKKHSADESVTSSRKSMSSDSSVLEKAKRARRLVSKEERHQRHRKKEKDWPKVDQNERSSRRLEDHGRQAQKQVTAKEISCIETRNILPSLLPEKRRKQRNRHSIICEERISHAQGNKKQRSRSSQKRDARVRRSSASREHRAAKWISEKEEVNAPKNAVSSKYSKFDSSPEWNEEAEKVIILSVKHGAHACEEAGTGGPTASNDLHLDDEEKTEIMNLGEEELLKLSPMSRLMVEEEQQRRLISGLPVYFPGISGCRNVEEFKILNKIEEGTFGVVYRAVERRTDEMVALKRLKVENEKEGFPITSLREIKFLLKAGSHPNIVNVREVVVSSDVDRIYLVMDYIEHDVKSLMNYMRTQKMKFTIGEVKNLVQQLLLGVRHMHEQRILHRDLKTSNLLLSRKGILKIGDFGSAREFGDPLKPYTPIVVTLWYRSPELLFGIKEYSTAVDMWSCGCIFAELLQLKPLFPGEGKLDQVSRIFQELGTPNDRVWPGYSSLPGLEMWRFEHHEFSQLRRRFPSNTLDEHGFELMNKHLLAYDPKERLSAKEALKHKWFSQNPLPTPLNKISTWSAESESSKAVTSNPAAKAVLSPDQARDEKLYRELNVGPPKEEPIGFVLKFDMAKFK